MTGEPILVAGVRARNEASILAETVPLLLRHCDAVVVLDNGSTDDTATVARDVGARVLAYRPPFYHEALERTVLNHLCQHVASELADGDLSRCYELYADSDEVWDGDLRAELETIHAADDGGALAWNFRMYDLRLCLAAPKEHLLASPLYPHRRWCEPFFRRTPKLFRLDGPLTVEPFREHHTPLPAGGFPQGSVRRTDVPIRHFGLCRSIADFEGKRERYTTQHAGQAYDVEWQQAKAVLAPEHLRVWEPGGPPPADATECHLGSNVAKRDLEHRERIISSVW